MPLPQFQYYVPDTLDEVFSLLQGLGEKARVLAGGTDLLVKMKQREIEPVPKHLIHIKRIPEMQHLQVDDQNGLSLGALATIQEIKTFVPLRQRYPGIRQAVSVMGTPQIRNIATLGGNLCNASPAAETAPVLMTLSAHAKVVGKGRERIVPLEEFFVGPEKTVLKSDELLVEIHVPAPPPNSTSVYLKHGKRLSDMATLGVACMLQMEGDKCVDAKIALASAGPTPMRTKKAEALMVGKNMNEELIEAVGLAVSEESRPRDSFRGTAALKREDVRLLAKVAVKQAMEQIKFGCP